MGKIEKTFVIFTIIYTLAYMVFFISNIGNFNNFDVIFPLHILATLLTLGFIIVIIRDIIKRKFNDETVKVIWILVILFFQPAVLVYLYKHGFKPREEIQEANINIKDVVVIVSTIVIFVGLMAFAMYSTMKGFKPPVHQPTLKSLASAGKDEELEKRLSSNSFDPAEMKSKDSWSPLHSAAGNNKPNTAIILLKYGADINHNCGCNGDTPLHVAAERGYYEVVKVLLEAGADRSIMNDDKLTALDLAIEAGYPATVELLSM